MDLVDLVTLIPDAIFDVRYASSNNITNKPLYKEVVVKLHKPAALALAQAAKTLTQQNYRLVIWDGYRSPDIQKQLLSVNSDPRYVLDPEASNHTKGLAIDLTLADSQGQYLDMGTDFDDFTTKAHVDAVDLT